MSDGKAQSTPKRNRQRRPKAAAGSTAKRPPEPPAKNKTKATRRQKPQVSAERVRAILERLHAEYGGAECALEHRNAYELLVATILSAQCTDERVNKVTPALFAAYPRPADLAQAEQSDVEALIRSTGFYRNKAKNLVGMAKALVDHHDGRVPADFEALVRMPGVARKTANVVMGTAFGQATGVVVDTHVARISGLLGLTEHKDAVKIERDLMALLPQDSWIDFSHMLIHHGRAICIARRPRCADCVLNDLCPSAFKVQPTNASRAGRARKNVRSAGGGQSG